MKTNTYFAPTRSASDAPSPDSLRSRLKDLQDSLSSNTPNLRSGPTVETLRVADLDYDDRPLVFGKAIPPFATVTVTWPDGNQSTTAAADAAGNWNSKAPVVQSSGTVSATATAAGVTSPPSGISYIDSAGPEIQNLSVVGATIEFDLAVSSDLTVTWPDGKKASFSAAKGGGTYVLNVPTDQPSGIITVSAKQQIPAPGFARRGRSASVTYVDLSAPPAPKFKVTDPKKNGHAKVKGSTVSIADPASTVIVVWPDGSRSNATVDPLGKWQAVSKNVQPPGKVKVMLVDPSGNSSESTAKSFRPRLPDAPTKLAVDDIDRDGKPWASGQARPHVTVEVTWPDGETGQTTASAAGRWQLKAAAPKPAGSVRAVVVDDRGNSSKSKAVKYP